ncbi:MAG: alpha/beta hydrolase, partial [Chloroflexi bacterium]|nr:alpha/beta hydrolase [Chloroflexota bacterium]
VEMIREDVLQAAGLQIHFYECGSLQEDSLLFVHGWSSSGRMWHETMRALSDEWRCLAPDLPGHGQSDKPPFAWYSVSNFAEAIGAWADRLGGLPRVAVGHSLGGAVVVELALRYPERIGRIVLVNPVVSGRVSYNLHALSGKVPRQTILDLGRRVWPRARAHLLRRAARGRAGARMKEYLQRNLQDLAQTTADSVLGSARAGDPSRFDRPYGRAHIARPGRGRDARHDRAPRGGTPSGAVRPASAARGARRGTSTDR